MCLTPSAHTKFIKKNQPRNEMHCTGFFPVKTVKHGLNLNCRRNKKEREREGGPEDGLSCKLISNGNLVFRVRAHVCETDRRARWEGGGGESKEKEGKIQFQITCACGAVWVGKC